MLEVVFVVGLVTGFFDSTVGAGGLISVPSLIFLGLPPQTAIATDRFGTMGQSFTATYKFWKAKKIVWRYVPVFAVLSLGGSIIGASLLTTVGAEILQRAVGVLLLLMLAIILVKRDLGVRRTSRKQSVRVVGFALYFLIAVFGGFFGQGTGPLVLFVLTYLLGLTVIEVLATNVIPWFVLSVSATIVFALHHLIDYKVGIVLFIGMAIGGYVGAHTAIRKGDVWVKRLFAVFVVVASVKLLLS